MSDAPKGRRRIVKALAFVCLAAVFGGASFAGYWWWKHQPAAEAAALEGEPAESEEPSVDNSGALLTFEPFLVNLSGGGGSQFLRTKVQLVVESEKRVAELQEQPVAVMRLRSSILELLAEQKAEVLVTAEGKAALKKALQERAARIGGIPILDVLFSDFVVQY